MERNFLFIESGRAGKEDRGALSEKIEKAFKDKGMEGRWKLVTTEREGHVADLAQAFAREQGERGVIYVCGGDGTLHEAANALVGSPCALGLIPTGTANDFAKTLYGRNWSEEEILRRAPSPRIAPMDLLMVNGVYCINLTSFGYDTVVLQKTYDILKKHPKLLNKAYYLAVLGTLFQKKSYRVTCDLHTEGERRVAGTYSVNLAAICNGGYYGSGFNPAPMAVVNDGIGEVCFAENLTMREFLSLILKYRKGTHLGHPKVHLERCYEGEFASTDGSLLMANYDGVIFKAPVIRFKVMPKALTFAYPEDQGEGWKA